MIKKLKSKFTLENLKRFMPYIILLTIMIVFYNNTKINGDDADYFSNILNGNVDSQIHNIKDFIIKRYNTWSSRLIIESTLIFMDNHIWIWQITTPLIYILLLYSIDRIFLKNDDKNYLMRYVITFLILLIPQKLFNTAGWYATTLNYLYPLSLFMFSLIPLKKITENKKIKIYEYIFYSLAFIFAINSEQILVIAILVDLSFIIYQIKTKNKNKLPIIYFIFAIIELIFVITCPGNKLRVQQETGKFFNNFSDLNIIDKFSLGLISTMQYYLYKNIAIYIVFNIVLINKILKNNKNNTIFQLISFYPLVLNLFLYFLVEHGVLEDENYMCNLSTILKSKEMFLIILMILNYLAIIINVFNSLSKDKKLIGTGIIIIGFISRIMLGFSASLYAIRTHLYLLISMIIVIIMVLDESYNKIYSDLVENNSELEAEKTNFYYLISFILVIAIIETMKGAFIMMFYNYNISELVY